ncbi:acyl--CoA ligase [Pseudohoeflea coraliihabitans]|uniref:Acyl--CoA ligase n=1 Tax=Pseudohoeflea coraliihabitans TaxID=2860393 RepID=A0ABS6WIC6_9HYPH|nr:acyl--CoA ligase [Pseudohoeflea sp. DP4N28-3]MBW3095707.1 acyl--CoA ligase [Pseudohoeflea sp. DP4N28-3]
MQSVRTCALQSAPHQVDAIAIAAPDRSPLTYAALARQIDAVVGDLGQRGFGPHSIIALCLPNGPEMATAFLGISEIATAAPLNPAYSEEELAFYLDDLPADLLIVPAGQMPAARAAASAAKIPILDLVFDPAAPAGTFHLEGAVDFTAPPAQASVNGGPGARNQPDDIALILHTSGTTGRPKKVGLRQRNLQASIASITNALALTPADRCLNVMPLFHIHGLIAALASTIASGGTIICTPGFNAMRFAGWLDAHDPTWFTAVPTMHQAAIERLARQPEGSYRGRLRFVRSSSAALPARVHAELEAMFDCPVIEAYGMTEAAHQISTNPIAPGQQQPASVGYATGADVAIMDSDGNLLPAGTSGEIVIRGANVHDGYLDNPDANATAFTNGWFRTGDLGCLQRDGRLRIEGRLKEIINRGGEKIAPLEIDAVLLRYPQIAQAVTFAVPHPLLGEDIAAVIVPQPGAEIDINELREFTRQRVAAFKVPRHIVIGDRIPTGATGKVQRMLLAGQVQWQSPSPLEDSATTPGPK